MHAIGIKRENWGIMLPVIVSKKKYYAIKKSLEASTPFHFYLSPKEVKATQEYYESIKDMSDDSEEREGGSIFGTILGALPIIGDVVGSLFNKGRGIMIGNKGGRIHLGGMIMKTFGAT